MPSSTRRSGRGSGFRNPLITGADIPDGSITTTKLDDLAVTTAKIADLNVSTAKIANLAVTGVKIGTAAITTAKIQDAAITNAKIDTLSASKITAGTITAQTITMGTGGVIQLSSGEVRTSTGSTYTQFGGGSQGINFYVSGSLVGFILQTAGNLRTSGDRLEFGAGGGASSVELFLDDNDFVIRVGGLSGNDMMRFSNTNYWRFGLPNSGYYPFNINISAQRIESTYIRDNTTAGSASLAIGGSPPQIMRSTSSVRYKAGLRPWDRRSSVLDLTPRLFRSKASADDSRRVRLGLIAEDVSERFPIAAIHDDKGRPDAIEWNSITAGIIADLQDLAERVATLEHHAGD